MPAITISRQYGSGEREIADQVCQFLGYRFFDKWLIVQLAAEVGLSKDEIIDFSEDNYKVRNLLARISETFAVSQRRSVNVPVFASGPGEAPTLSITQMDEKSAVALTNATILAAYKLNFVVIVGRGGQMVLKDKPNVLHVRLEAPLNARIARVQAEEKLTREQAQLLIEERDRAAAQYLERYYKVRWDDPLLYHLIVNTGKMEPEAAAQLIITAMLQI